MAMTQALGSPSAGQTCALILIFTVLLQALCVAVTYMYFTNELKQCYSWFAENDCQKLVSVHQRWSVLPQ
ncbi:tumor necrosis factor ligand superfamily member 10 isoform X2 [Nycticebus coucang]|uniref:tumor necrosis factor ligand superfamily member 10 isoform X2 n=1 Tax=Nycticebus coucang TaxID=9470 RepID=UPI00234D167C|nr:tumor necrosis factor ligand superfamily member 10 isoform X2 [Nycticebus coucang]